MCMCCACAVQVRRERLVPVDVPVHQAPADHTLTTTRTYCPNQTHHPPSRLRRATLHVPSPSVGAGAAGRASGCACRALRDTLRAVAPAKVLRQYHHERRACSRPPGPPGYGTCAHLYPRRMASSAMPSCGSGPPSMPTYCLWDTYPCLGMLLIDLPIQATAAHASRSANAPLPTSLPTPVSAQDAAGILQRLRNDFAGIRTVATALAAAKGVAVPGDGLPIDTAAGHSETATACARQQARLYEAHETRWRRRQHEQLSEHHQADHEAARLPKVMLNCDVAPHCALCAILKIRTAVLNATSADRGVMMEFNVGCCGGLSLS